MLHAVVHGADIQDRDDGAVVMATLFALLAVPSETRG